MHLLARGMGKFGVDVRLFYTGSLRSPTGLVRARHRIIKMAPEYDLVHAQFGSACSAVTTGVKTKKIVSLRGSDWYRYNTNSFSGDAHSFLASSMTRWSLPKYDAVVTMSNRMLREVKARFRNVIVYSIPDPIDLTKFIPLNRAAARLKLFGKNSNDYWILFATLSTGNPVKRVSLAQSAVDIVRQRLGNVELKVASNIDHNLMPLFVASCDAVLSTSTHEGWPNIIKEALACNIPFVATDVSDLREVAGLDPSCRITEPNPEAIATHLCEVLQQRSETLLRHHVEKMGLEQTCASLFQVYQRTLIGDTV